MKRRALVVVVAWLFVVAGIGARLGNGWNFPALGSYDAFSHFTYIWYLAQTGRVPVAAQGWSYFHPPVYYAFMAVVWKLLDGSDPLLRLRIGTEAIAVLGLLHPLLAWAIVRRRVPRASAVPLLSACLLLFVPVLVYSAGFLGNEGLHAVLGSLSLLALLRVLRVPTTTRAATLGLVLGLALLTKFTAVTIAAASVATLLMRIRWTKDFAGGRRALLVSSVVALLVCGPYYARNLHLYGRPFQMARDITFATAYVENNQPQAARGWADYLTFDPLIFRRPVWPRGSTPSLDDSAHGFARAVRESVWTGLYANTWFDGFGGWVLPPVTESEGSRRAGQLLLALGLVPTSLMFVGVWSGIAALRRRGWDDEIVAFGLTTAAMFALFVYGTHEAPIAAAVKATYFTPVCLAFAFWFALGLGELERRSPNWLAAAIAGCAVLAVVSFVVFCEGLVFDPNLLRSSIPGYSESILNQYGVVFYAGGQTARAREAFEHSAAAGNPLAVENLAFLAVDAGRAVEGLRLLRRAARLQRNHPEGGPIGRQRFLELTEAEYDHSMAVVLHGLGRRQRAEAMWHRALLADPTHAEALWCLTLTRLEDELATASDDGGRRAAFDDAARALANVRALDPGFREGWTLASTVEAARGDCDAARRIMAAWVARPWWVERRFAAEAGNGAGFAASIGRRRLIAPHRGELAARDGRPACEDGHPSL